MAFTYNAAPDTSTDAGKRDTVRLLTGDTDTNDQQLQDAEVDFLITDAGSNLYLAASRAARAIAAKYSRLVEVSVDGATTRFGQRQKHYQDLAHKLEKTARLQSALGTPTAGGISKDEIESAIDDEDRPEPAFERRQFRNPPRFADDEEYEQR